MQLGWQVLIYQLFHSILRQGCKATESIHGSAVDDLKGYSEHQDTHQTEIWRDVSSTTERFIRSPVPDQTTRLSFIGSPCFLAKHEAAWMCRRFKNKGMLRILVMKVMAARTTRYWSLLHRITHTLVPPFTYFTAPMESTQTKTKKTDGLEKKCSFTSLEKPILSKTLIR